MARPFVTQAALVEVTVLLLVVVIAAADDDDDRDDDNDDDRRLRRKVSGRARTRRGCIAKRNVMTWLLHIFIRAVE